MNEIKTGQRFGNLTALCKTDKKWNSYSIWECLCDCGKKITSSSYYLLKGKSKSCGINGHLINLSGEKFGKLLAIKKAPNKGNFSAWHCKCDCGKEFIAETRGLINNRTKSCGCDKRPHLENKRFGKLLVLKEIIERSQAKSVKWECLCDCGNKVFPTTTRLLHGKAVSCGCCTRKDLTGKKFGKLTVIKRGEKKSPCYSWLCKCICGKEVDVLSSSLSSGTTKSCGCSRIIYKDRSLPAKKKLYGAYKGVARKKHLEFNLSYEEFIYLTSQNCYYCDSPPSNKMGEGKLTKTLYVYSGIDRKDNSKGYFTENCVPCCKICNLAKKDMTIEKFIGWLSNLGKNLRLQGYG
jgi:hypothetical protein